MEFYGTASHGKERVNVPNFHNGSRNRQALDAKEEGAGIDVGGESVGGGRAEIVPGVGGEVRAGLKLVKAAAALPVKKGLVAGAENSSITSGMRASTTVPLAVP